MNQLAECPNCHSTDVYGVTRVVGYFAIIENMNDSKRSEIRDRKLGDYSVESVKPALPLKFNFGDDGVYLIGKEDCTICVSEKEIIVHALNQAGFDNQVKVYEKKLADKNGAKRAENLSFAVKSNVDLNKIPAVVAVKDSKVKYVAHIGDKQNTVTMEDLVKNFKEVYGEMNLLTAV
jgi:hypothetical protein